MFFFSIIVWIPSRKFGSELSSLCWLAGVSPLWIIVCISNYFIQGIISWAWVFDDKFDKTITGGQLTNTVNSGLANILRTLAITDKIEIPGKRGLTGNDSRYYGLSLKWTRNEVPSVSAVARVDCTMQWVDSKGNPITDGREMTAHDVSDHKVRCVEWSEIGRELAFRDMNLGNCTLTYHFGRRLYSVVLQQLRLTFWSDQRHGLHFGNKNIPASFKL